MNRHTFGEPDAIFMLSEISVPFQDARVIEWFAANKITEGECNHGVSMPIYLIFILNSMRILLDERDHAWIIALQESKQHG